MAQLRIIPTFQNLRNNVSIQKNGRQIPKFLNNFLKMAKTGNRWALRKGLEGRTGMSGRCYVF